MIRIFFKSGSHLDLGSMGPMQMADLRTMCHTAALKRDWVDLKNDQQVPIASFPGEEVRLLLVTDGQTVEATEDGKKGLKEPTPA